MQTVILTDQIPEKPILNTWTPQGICLDKLRCRDRSEFMALYKLYAPAIYGLVLRNLSDNEKCNQALEQTFIQAWNKIESYDESKCSLFTWLSRLASKSWQNTHP